MVSSATGSTTDSESVNIGSNPILPSILKTCAICKTPKELTEFHKRGPSREGKFNSYCKPCRSARRKAEHLALKVETFNQYGGIICSCCGETEFCFLALDHINNNGNKHRKLINNGRGGLTFYAKLKVLGFQRYETTQRPSSC